MKILRLFCLLIALAGNFCGAAFGAELKSYGFGTSDIIRDDKRDRVYCAVPAQNSVVVIDSESLQVLATIFTGSQPNALAESPDGSQLYVANLGSTSQGLTVLDLDSLTIIRSIQTTDPVLDVAVGIGTVYTIEGSTLRAYKTSDGTPKSGSMTGMSVYGGCLGISPNGKTLYYYQTGLSPSTWYRLDVTAWPGAVLQSGQYGSNGQNLALSADGQWITFVSGSPYSVNKLQASNPTVSLGQFNTDAYPHAAAYSPDGNTLFTVHTSGQIDVWNANTYIALAPITTVGEPDDLVCDRKGKVLFAGNGSSLRAYYIGPIGNGGPLNVAINLATEIRWDSVAGNLYQIEWKTTPVGNTDWLSLGGPILGNGLTMSVFDTTRGQRAKFYRVRQISP